MQAESHHRHQPHTLERSSSGRTENRTPTPAKPLRCPGGPIPPGISCSMNCLLCIFSTGVPSGTCAKPFLNNSISKLAIASRAPVATLKPPLSMIESVFYVGGFGYDPHGCSSTLRSHGITVTRPLAHQVAGHSLAFLPSIQASRRIVSRLSKTPVSSCIPRLNLTKPDCQTAQVTRHLRSWKWFTRVMHRDSRNGTFRIGLVAASSMGVLNVRMLRSRGIGESNLEAHIAAGHLGAIRIRSINY